ncbi:MAG: cytochrome c oxidase subunit II [Steroidobacteraceae bacterium]
MSRFFAMPPAASAFAGRVDTLLFTVTAVTGAVAIAITVTIIVFSLRYRRSRTAPRQAPPGASGSSRRLEIAWIGIPLLVFMSFYVWGARLYFDYARAPAKSLEIYVVAKQWMWELEHRNGRREINTLHVPRGAPVRLIMTSQDAIHSFFVPGLRIKHDVLPGRYESLQFTATRDGTYHLFCAEYCGTDHARMGGQVFIMEPADYGRWLDTGGVQESLAGRGAALFRQSGCSGCHAAGSQVHAPDLNGLFGRMVPLSDGSFVKADERYVRDSILQPSAQIAAGYADLMPSYVGRLSDEDLLELMEYLKSLAGGEGAGP